MSVCHSFILFRKKRATTSLSAQLAHFHMRLAQHLSHFSVSALKISDRKKMYHEDLKCSRLDMRVLANVDKTEYDIADIITCVCVPCASNLIGTKCPHNYIKLW